MDTSIAIAGTTEKYAYKVTIDHGIFGSGQPVKFGIRQDVTLFAQGHSKTIRDYIAKPEQVSGNLSPGVLKGSYAKFVVEAAPSSNTLSPSSSSSNTPPVSPTRPKSPSGLGGMGGAIHGTGASVVRWRGEAQAIVESSHMKSKKEHRFIDAFSSYVGELYSIRHTFELCISVRGDKSAANGNNGVSEVKFEAPAVFVDCDKDTRDWVMRNSNALKQEE
ncbi:hypothetical protein HDU76_013732 [Blyttiomyces sp. JEL0837]|nr:hypothetical protein HDU76_013732 [Blyttiomyces sp. JEL0837]